MLRQQEHRSHLADDKVNELKGRMEEAGEAVAASEAALRQQDRALEEASVLRDQLSKAQAWAEELHGQVS